MPGGAAAGRRGLSDSVGRGPSPGPWHPGRAAAVIVTSHGRARVTVTVTSHGDPPPPRPPAGATSDRASLSDLRVRQLRTAGCGRLGGRPGPGRPQWPRAAAGRQPRPGPPVPGPPLPARGPRLSHHDRHGDGHAGPTAAPAAAPGRRPMLRHCSGRRSLVRGHGPTRRGSDGRDRSSHKLPPAGLSL